MSRGRRRIRQEQTAGRPSIFFIVALAAGILFLLWFFLQALKHPVNEQKRGSLKAATARTIVRISVS
jgi:arginine exporter protein ArgO